MQHPFQQGSLSLVICNLSLLSAALALVSIWILFYTDWLVVVGSLIGLVGVFAFLANLITESRKNSLRTAFETQVLARGWTSLAVILSLIVWGLAAVLSGTVVVRSFGDDSSRTIAVERMAGARRCPGPPLREDVLAGRSQKKFFLWQGFIRRDYRVKLSGLPAATVGIRPLRRSILYSPDDFLRRPILLVRPTYFLSQAAAQNQFSLVVERRGQEIVRTPFPGKAMWIGCDADVAVPPELKSHWQLTLGQQDLPASFIESWLPPIAPDESMNVVLAPEDSLRISIETAQRETYVTPIEIVVHRNYRKEDFPLEVVLDVPR